MSATRLLIGTRKGAFCLTSDETRRKWDIQGPHFGGWEIYHVNASPVDPNRIYASQSTGWHGQVVQRSDDGGGSWEPVSNDFTYAGEVGTHLWYDGTPHPYEFARVWHLEPAPDDPDTVYAGVEDAALFRSTDAGATWRELPALRTHETSGIWAPGAGGMCLHTVLVDPNDPRRLYVAISAAGVLRSDDGGESWELTVDGLKAPYLPDPPPEAGFCVHRIAMHAAKPDVLYMQKHWGVYRSDNRGDHWTNIGSDLPSDFGFPIAINANDPDTVYVVPITSDAEHYPPSGALRVWRTRNGGGSWEELADGLPERDCYVNVLRDAMAVDAGDPCGVYFGTTGGQVFASPDGGDTWTAATSHLPAVLSVEAQTLR